MREHREVKVEVKEPVPKPEPTPSPVAPEIKSFVTEEPKSGSSGWKWFALILFVLVIVSIFTNGFGLYSKAVPGQVTMTEAETKMLDYVNTNLLPAPLVAEVVDHSEESTLYRFTLSVAGELVESYVTKDGQLFFPRGFEMNNNTVIVLDQDPVNTSKPETSVPVTTANGTELTISAKKWMFDPNTLYVKVGENVKLTIKSTDLDFVFSIPDLGVQTAVSGITLVEFTPSKAGKYKYLCSSCDSWRGLEGTLIVE
jgi:heme/copper-type cytochrome/quinol oxidase subunit 2